MSSFAIETVNSDGAELKPIEAVWVSQSVGVTPTELLSHWRDAFFTFSPGVLTAFLSVRGPQEIPIEETQEQYDPNEDDLKALTRTGILRIRSQPSGNQLSPKRLTFVTKAIILERGLDWQAYKNPIADSISAKNLPETALAYFLYGPGLGMFFEKYPKATVLGLLAGVLQGGQTGQVAVEDLLKQRTKTLTALEVLKAGIKGYRVLIGKFISRSVATELYPLLYQILAKNEEEMDDRAKKVESADPLKLEAKVKSEIANFANPKQESDL